MPLSNRRLKTLESSDLLPIKDKNGDFLLVTKQETSKMIRELILNEVEELSSKFSNDMRKTIEKNVNTRLEQIEKSIDSFIEHRFNQLAEKTCEMLITRHFNNEVTRKAEDLIDKKKNKGKF